MYFYFKTDKQITEGDSMRKYVSKEEEEIWARRYLQGETCRNISKDYPQYHESTISRHIKKLDLSRGKGHLKEKDDKKQIILEEYIKDKYATCTSLGKKYNISDRTISTWLKQNNIPLKQSSGVISHCKEDYFSKIDNPNKAYLLGFITADGAVTGKKEYEPTTCSIEVKDDDCDVVKFAQQEINPEATITPCYYDKKHNVRISFNSKKLCTDLAKYGIVRNKSKIIESVPVHLIPKELLCYYFRGLIDGDGCIHKNGGISIYSGSKRFIESVQEILIQETGVKKLGIYEGTTYFITWTSKQDKIKLFNYLYNNLNATFYYKRKYNRICNSLYGNTEVTN